jgi:hypothetical protein
LNVIGGWLPSLTVAFGHKESLMAPQFRIAQVRYAITPMLKLQFAEVRDEDFHVPQIDVSEQAAVEWHLGSHANVYISVPSNETDGKTIPACVLDIAETHARKHQRNRGKPRTP